MYIELGEINKWPFLKLLLWVIQPLHEITKHEKLMIEM